jgi:hypothetical protein
MDRRIKKEYHRELKTVFTLNFLPYKPTGPVSYSWTVEQIGTYIFLLLKATQI